MENNKSKDLLEDYNMGTCTEDEKAIVESWFLNWKEVSNGPTEEQFERMNQEVWESILQTNSKKLKINWPLRMVSTAAAVAIIVSTLFFILKRDPSMPVTSLSDIHPGTNKATLLLSNGEIIKLSEAKTGILIRSDKILYNDHSEVTASRSASHNEVVLSTPRGGQYQVILPDGSKVWLNANSKISFPAQFSGKERKISLSGEAYFEVSKDKKRPFIVSTDQQKVEVLGTHFNINAYSEDKSTTTTLLEGSVRVSPKKHHPRDGVVLKPNEQANNSGKSMEVTKVDPDDVIAWKNGEFAFNNEPLSAIMPRLARWYDVQISYENTEIGNKRLNGTISKFGKISEILSMLELTGEVHFKIEGRRIIVMH